MTPRYRPETRVARAAWKRSRRGALRVQRRRTTQFGRINARDALRARDRQRALWANGRRAGIRALWADRAPVRALFGGA